MSGNGLLAMVFTCTAHSTEKYVTSHALRPCHCKLSGPEIEAQLRQLKGHELEGKLRQVLSHRGLHQGCNLLSSRCWEDYCSPLFFKKRKGSPPRGDPLFVLPVIGIKPWSQHAPQPRKVDHTP